MAAQLQILNLFFLLPLHLPLMKWIATSLLPFLLPGKSSRTLTEEKLLIKFRRRSFPPQLDIIKTKASLPELSKLGLFWRRQAWWKKQNIIRFIVSQCHESRPRERKLFSLLSVSALHKGSAFGCSKLKIRGQGGERSLPRIFRFNGVTSLSSAIT